MNAEGVLEIKPLTNEKIDYQTDKTLANGILKLETKIKTVPGVEFEHDQPYNFNRCPLHGESGTEHVVEQMADCSADNQFQPIVITPQPHSSEISTVCELQESDTPVESCRTILYDSVLGPTTFKIDIFSNEAQTPEQQLEQQQQVVQVRTRKQKQVWPKYTSQRDVDSSRRQDNQRKKFNNAGFLTYYGHKIMQCSVKLKRLKLTPDMVDQLYTMRQKAKQEKYYKLKMSRKARTLYKGSSSENDCDSSPSGGQNKTCEYSRVSTFILPQDKHFPATEQQQQVVQVRTLDEQRQVWPKYMSQRDVDSSQRRDNQRKKFNNAGFLTYYDHKIMQCSVKLKRLKLTPDMVDQLYTMRQKAKQEKYYKLKMRRKAKLYEDSSSEDDDCDFSPSGGQNKTREIFRGSTFILPDNYLPNTEFSNRLSSQMTRDPVSSDPQFPDSKKSWKNEPSTLACKPNEDQVGNSPARVESVEDDGSIKLPNIAETIDTPRTWSCTSAEIKEPGKIASTKSSAAVMELSDMDSEATTIPVVENKQSSETKDASCEESDSETDDDENCEAANDPNFVPDAISGDDSEEVNSSDCSASDMDDEAGDLSLVSESEVTEFSVRTDNRIPLTTRAPTPSDPVLHEFEDYLLD